MKTLTANITETLEDWFASHGLEVKRIAVSRKDCNEARLEFACGEFAPTLFDKSEDGAAFVLAYQQELATKDERFENTVLEFDTDTTFRIV